MMSGSSDQTFAVKPRLLTWRNAIGAICGLAIITLAFGWIMQRQAGMTLAGEVARTRASLGNYRVALNVYRENVGVFPTTAQGLDALVTRPTTEPKPKMWRKVFEHEVLDLWGRKFIYKCPGERNPQGYDLFSVGPDGKAGTADDIWQ